MVKSKLAWALCLSLLVTGCKQETQNSLQARFYENGTAKPIVALVPLIDSSRHDLPWSISDEITALVHYRLMQKETLYLVDDEKVSLMIKRMKEGQNPFDTDLLWMKKVFFEDEFVVFMNLIHHEQAPLSTQGAHEDLTQEHPSSYDLPTELNLSVKIRVIDLRGEVPKVALQEVIQNSHFIPKQFTSDYFSQVGWGKENYSISPIGLAHAQMSREISARLEDYILLSMSRKYE